MEIDDEAPGWAAINQACERLYPDQSENLAWAPPLPPQLGGGPLSSIQIYRSNHVAWHWHYVTLGFSDLFGERLADSPEAVSGLGFELTFRLLDRGAEDPTSQPPGWPVSLLNNLANYCFKRNRLLAAGHSMDAGGPIKLDDPTKLHALAFIADRELGSIETPSGRVDFVQAVGLTIAERQAATRWQVDRFMKLFESRFPLSISMLERGDLMADPAFAEQVGQGIERDGSSNGIIYGEHIECYPEGEELVVELGATTVADLVDLLPLRVPYNKLLMVKGIEQSVSFLLAGKSEHHLGATGVGIKLVATASHDIAETLQPKRGDYRVESLPGLIWRVVPSEITDAQGEVVETIG